MNKVEHRLDGTSLIHLRYKAQSTTAVIDTADYPLVANFRWHAHKSNRGSGTFYARAWKKVDGKRSDTTIHQILMGANGTDHKDLDGLNNCRSNLRPATHSQNHQNEPKRRGTSSRFKGVYWHTKRARWIATVKLNGKKQHLGSYTSEADAARAYNVAAKNAFGEFARLNAIP